MLTIKEPKWRPRSCPRCGSSLYRETTGRRDEEGVWHCLSCARMFGEEEVPEYILREVEERRGRRV